MTVAVFFWQEVVAARILFVPDMRIWSGRDTGLVEVMVDVVLEAEHYAIRSMTAHVSSLSDESQVLSFIHFV